jgi:hypothetical protein
LAGTRFHKALQGHRSVTEYSTSAGRSANCSLLYPLPTMKRCRSAASQFTWPSSACLRLACRPAWPAAG